ncbi:MAG: hypothetical protein MR850_03455 [Bacteroidales bacterium]|nr:hypothetical protein [Bacteroidales bacterium]
MKSDADILKNRMRSLMTMRLSPAQVADLRALAWADGSGVGLDALYSLTCDADERVSVNALYVFTHFSDEELRWLLPKHDELVHRAMEETNTTRLRLTLWLLLHQPFCEDDLCAEFIDFCLNGCCASSQPYAIRAQCMKLAYEQCRYYPELLEELRRILEMLAEEPLSAGVESARRQVLKKIKSRGKR